MFGKDGFCLLVGCNLTLGHRRKRLIDRLEFLGSRIINTVSSRLDFKGDLRKLILVVLGPMRDPRQHMFCICIHGAYLTRHSFECTLHGRAVSAANSHPAAKLSDNPQKATGTPQEIARYLRVFGGEGRVEREVVV